MDSKTGEKSEDLIAPETQQNSKLITLDLTELDIFAIVSTVQLAGNEIREDSLLYDAAKQVAKKMHDYLDPNSPLFFQLKKGWASERPKNSSLKNFLTENFPIEGFRDG
jgi:hypothetical protein